MLFIIYLRFFLVAKNMPPPINTAPPIKSKVLFF